MCISCNFFLWSDTDSDTVIWRKKFPLNWDFTKSQAWNNIMLEKEAQLDLVGRYIGKKYISLKEKHLIDHIEKS